MRLKRVIGAVIVAVALAAAVKPAAGLLCDYFPWSIECWLLSAAPAGPHTYPMFLVR